MDRWYALTAPFMADLTLWSFCLAFWMPLRRRPKFWLRAFAAFLIILAAGAAGPAWTPEARWLEVACCCVSVFLAVFACCRLSVVQAIYGAIWILLTHQLTMECWIVFHAFASRTWELGILFVPLRLFFHALAGGVLGLTICRWLPQDGVYRVGPRQFLSALILLLIFEVNYCALFYDEAFPNDPLRLAALPLTQFYCVCTLYFQNALFRKSELQQELDLLDRLRHEQQQQYDLAKEHIAIIDRKCHDLKHQMAAMRTMVSPENHEKYLSEIEKSVRIYDSILKTGNEVLDTVLTEKSLFCEANQIAIHCVADGSRLDLMDPVDLYTVFGNALDNAIESVQLFQAAEKRTIDVLICEEKGCLVVQIVNPLAEDLTFVDGLPVTTKERDGYHGYGLKSIRHTVARYGGHLTVRAENGRFSLKILIPLEDT